MAIASPLHGVIGCVQRKPWRSLTAPLLDGRTEAPLSSRNARIDLAPTAASVPAARHLVLELLRAGTLPRDAEEGALLVTKFVPSVGDHVGGEATLPLDLETPDAWRRIAVVEG